jgi:hypothetical protein
MPRCDLGRPDSDDEFAGHAVASAEFVGAVGTHAAAADTGSDVEQVFGAVLYSRGTLHLHERIRRMRVVNT